MKSNVIRLIASIGMVLLVVPCLSAAEKSTLTYAERRLEHYIRLVNHTKKILDEPNVQPNMQQQKKALCQRIAAYQGILQLSVEYPEMDNAAVMQMIAQNYLTQQQRSFDSSAMNQQAFCNVS